MNFAFQVKALTTFGKLSKLIHRISEEIVYYGWYLFSSFVNMKKNLKSFFRDIKLFNRLLLFLSGVLIIGSCHQKSSSELPAITITKEEEEALNIIKSDFRAEKLKYSIKYADLDTEKITPEIITIEIINSKKLKLDDLNLDEHFHSALSEFVKSYKPETKYSKIGRAHV